MGPFSRDGKAGVAPYPPWLYAADFITIEYPVRNPAQHQVDRRQHVFGGGVVDRAPADGHYRGFVRQNPATRAYEPGQALSSIAFAIRRQVDIRTLARPVLERLFEETGETVHFARLERTDTQFIDATESLRAVRVGSRQGVTLLANCTATGKAMLSLLDEEQLRKLLSAGGTPEADD